MSDMMLGSTSQRVEFNAVLNSVTPDPTESCVPVGHGLLINFVKQECKARIPYAQFLDEQYALQDAPHPTWVDAEGKSIIVQDANCYAKLIFGWEDHRWSEKSWKFGLVIRNSHVKKFCMEVAVALIANLCDNLTIFGGRDATHAKQKHSRYGFEAFDSKITKLLRGAESQFVRINERIERLQNFQVSDGDAAQIILLAQHLKALDAKECWSTLQEWKASGQEDHRHFEEFGVRTGWSLQNAMTQIIKPSILQKDQLRGEGIFQSLEHWMGNTSDIYREALTGNGAQVPIQIN